MSLSPLELDWRSQMAEVPSPGKALPARIATPALAWDYGAATEPVTPADPEGVLRLRVRVERGGVGVAVLALNFGALLTTEAHLRPEDGEAALLFDLPQRFGPCRLLIRTWDDGGPAQATVLSAEVGTRADLSDAEKAAAHSAAAATYAPVFTEELKAWAPPRDSLFIPVSLGATCEAKFQIARTLEFRRDPQASELAFRLAMLPPNRASDTFGWDIFDWQGASLKAVLAYLQRDFQGVFEREDLQATGTGVVHRELGTEHMHDFEFLLDHPAAPVTAEVLERGYDQTRARFDAMAERFRAHLRRRGPFLYVQVCDDVPSEWDVKNLVEALRARSPEHRFRLLFVATEGSDTPWGDYACALADKAFRPRTWSKPEGREWEGPDEAWDAALAPYRLAFPDGSPA